MANSLNTKDGYTRISKYRSKKNPFKVGLFGANHEQTYPSENLSTRTNCIKSLLSVMRLFHGTSISVIDVSGKEVKYFVLDLNGKELAV